MRSYWVYMLSNHSGTLYVGMTNNIRRRMNEHKAQQDPDSFSTQYKLSKLIYLEEYSTAKRAIAREKQLKGWRRKKKVALINQANPSWDDLAAEINTND